jgi:hypothetical protein
MTRTPLLVACLAGLLAGLLAVTMTSAGAAPGGTVPIAGGNAELSFAGTFTVTGFGVADKRLRLQGTLSGPLTGSYGDAADLADLPAQLLVETVEPACEPPGVTVATGATTVAVPGFDAITLPGLVLVRPVDPADTSLVETVCQLAGEADQRSKLKGRRLADAVDALNALGGTWQLAPPPPGA